MQRNLYLWLIPTLPLLGAAWGGLAGKWRSERQVATVATGSVALSFLVALRAFWLLGGAPHLESHFPWIAAGGFRADLNFYLDPLSAVMTLVVAGVGLLVHIYAAGYMSREGGYCRFFAYLNLSLFFMLTLVLAGNYALLFVGWEGVSLCSYLLIGFYFRNPAAAEAGKKAFLVTRCSAFAFLIALLLLYKTFHSLNFFEVLPAAAQVPVETDGFGPLTWICLLLLMGAAGVSTQLPLYVWLPDAMLGPTPVSALIQAATVVTAGVYIIARSSVLYIHAPDALFDVAVVVGITALYVAAVALAQAEVRRILAYSTIFVRLFLLACTEVLWKGVDQRTIDGALIQAARRTRSLGGIVRRFQSGNIRSYAAWVVLGAILLISFMVVAA